MTQEPEYVDWDEAMDFVASFYLIDRQKVANMPIDRPGRITLAEWVQARVSISEFASARDAVEAMTPDERGALIRRVDGPEAFDA